jgi:hypothetical protein
MFYFVTYLDYDTHKITLHDFTENRNNVTNLIKCVAENFIRRENGESRVETCFVKGQDEMNIDGFYLVLSGEQNWVIDVYKRNTNVISGWFVNGADVVIKNIGRYAVSETSLDLPSHTSSTTSITKPHFDNIQTEVNFSNVLEELKQKQKTIDLSIQGKKISHYIPLVPYFSDDDISESLPSDYSYYDSSSDEDSTMW